MPRFLARLAAVAALVLVAACAQEDLTAPPPDIGDFRLGYNIVVAKNAQPVGPSRQATPEEWEAVLKEEVGKRLGRYEGEKLYHIGIGVDAYALAIPGIPLVLKPKSVLAITVSIWDDAAGVKVNSEPKKFTVFERGSEKTFIGSGLTQTKEEQMTNLSANAARQIMKWIEENKAWFTPEAVEARRLAPKVPGQTTLGMPPAPAAN